MLAAAAAIEAYAQQQVQGHGIAFTLVMWDAEGYCVRGNGKPEQALPALKAVVADIETGVAQVQKPALSS